MSNCHREQQQLLTISDEELCQELLPWIEADAYTEACLEVDRLVALHGHAPRRLLAALSSSPRQREHAAGCLYCGLRIHLSTMAGPRALLLGTMLAHIQGKAMGGKAGEAVVSSLLQAITAPSAEARSPEPVTDQAKTPRWAST